MARSWVESWRGVRACSARVRCRRPPGSWWHSAPWNRRCCAWGLGRRSGVWPWRSIGHTGAWVLRPHAGRPRSRRHGAPWTQGARGWVCRCTVGPGELREGHVRGRVRPCGAVARGSVRARGRGARGSRRREGCRGRSGWRHGGVHSWGCSSKRHGGGCCARRGSGGQGRRSTQVVPGAGTRPALGCWAGFGVALSRGFGGGVFGERISQRKLIRHLPSRIRARGAAQRRQWVPGRWPRKTRAQPD